ncbi:MAG: FAD-dependent oxidoreductase [Alphaproteobacteria bacterium]|jgi:glycine oxidase|nr:FAD-dependent oxidoreductase [Alphaproteobacteria bacterium]
MKSSPQNSKRGIAPKIAVAGAGVMGLSAAHALRQFNVTVFDTDRKNSASAMAGGMLAPWAEIEHLPENFLEAAVHGIALWGKIIGSLDEKIEFHRNGSLIVAHRDDEYILERLAAKLPQQKIIDAEKIAALEPSLSRFTSGLYLKDEAHTNPQQVLNALAASVNHIHENADIETLRKKFDYVIDCRGFAAAKDDRELRGVKGEIVIVRNKDFTLSRPVRLAHPRYPLYIVPRRDNVFMIGATLIESADNAITVKSALELLSAAFSLHPSFAESEILDIRAGIRPAYPDNLPRITIEDNIIRCNGLFRHGFLLAPVMAACVADFIAGKQNNFISLFRSENDDHHHQRPAQKRQLRA